MTVRLADVIAILEAAYPPGLAQDWDAVGLVCGDPDDVVASILVAVDPVPETVDETLETGAQLLLTHHPLLLRGVHGVGADTPKGALVHRLVRGGAALFTAHTNADAANPGVSDALAHALGVSVDGPLEAALGPPLDKIVTFVPVGPAIPAVHQALAAAGAGAVGDDSHRSFASAGTGQVKPTSGANPVVANMERVAETRLEMVLPRRRRAAVVAALRAAHPHDEPAFDVLELADLPAIAGPRAGRHAHRARAAACVRRPGRGRAARNGVGRAGGRRRRPPDPAGRRLRWVGRLGAAGGGCGRRRCVRHRGPAPPSGGRARPRPSERAGARGRRALGIGVALVCAGGRDPPGRAGR